VVEGLGTGNRQHGVVAERVKGERRQAGALLRKDRRYVYGVAVVVVVAGTDTHTAHAERRFSLLPRTFTSRWSTAPRRSSVLL
jgi:hypothetical protein